MSWDIIDGLDRNDTEVRQLTRVEQAGTADFLTDLVAHLFVGLQRRGSRGLMSEAEQWAAIFLAHAAASIKCAFDQLLGGYYSQSMGGLRNVMEDAIVVANLSHHPEEAAKYTAARARLDEDIAAGKVKTGAYRIKLAALGDVALTAGMDKAKEMVDVLHQYAHPSLYAVTLALTDEGLSTAGYYATEDFAQAAYMFISTFHFVAAAAATLIGVSDPRWTEDNASLIERSAEWTARANLGMGVPLSDDSA